MDENPVYIFSGDFKVEKVSIEIKSFYTKDRRPFDVEAFFIRYFTKDEDSCKDFEQRYPIDFY